jgi:hypothetical protein
MSGIIGMSIAEGIRIEMPTSLPDRDINFKSRPCPPSKSIKKRSLEAEVDDQT